jgi:hypothetical protein
MPKINIEHQCNLKTDEAFTKIKSFLQNEQEIKKLDPKVVCQFNEAQKTGKANGSQFKADISVKEHSSGSLVQLVVDLPMLLTPFKNKIQETIQRKLSKYLG